ncbi:hypothetical protein T06_5926 [Trichinella sp. T6]|nr:hypothetical protein T06_5926 [Trichinella sp. T6]
MVVGVPEIPYLMEVHPENMVEGVPEIPYLIEVHPEVIYSMHN